MPPLSQLALHDDRTLQLGQDPVAQAKPRPMPLPTSLVVKNGLKTLALVRSFMPLPSSLNRISTKSPAWRVVMSIVPLPSAGGLDRVARVGGEVDENLLELQRIGVDLRECRGQNGVSTEMPREANWRASIFSASSMGTCTSTISCFSLDLRMKARR